MNRAYLRLAFCVLVLLTTSSFSSVYAVLRDNNLIEFSRGSYPNMSLEAILWPPFVKIYQDGKVIYDEGGKEPKYFISQLDSEQLASLKKLLAGEKYLWKSRFIDMPGDNINVHGGVSYIRYLDGDKEILIATEVKPKAGPWVELTDAIWEYVPDDHQHVYYPNSIGVETSVETSEWTNQKPPDWPFASQIQLSAKLKIISNPEVIRYLFDRLAGVFSMYAWDLKQGGKRYSMILTSSPGWFEPDYVNKALKKVRNNGYRVTEK